MIESPEELHRAFQDAFNRGDLDAVVALYQTDAVLIGFDGPVTGADAIRERYRLVLATHPIIDVQTLSVNRAGDVAVLEGKWFLRETGPDGIEVCRQGRNTETARCRPDGSWLFVIDNPSVPQE